jgi:hypothetical protein
VLELMQAAFAFCSEQNGSLHMTGATACVRAYWAVNPRNVYEARHMIDMWIVYTLMNPAGGIGSNWAKNFRPLSHRQIRQVRAVWPWRNRIGQRFQEAVK